MFKPRGELKIIKIAAIQNTESLHGEDRGYQWEDNVDGI